MTLQSPPLPVHTHNNTTTQYIEPIKKQLDRHLHTCQTCKKLPTHTVTCMLGETLYNTVTIMTTSLTRNHRN